MQLTLAAAALIATASAATFQRREEYNFNSSCDAARPLAKVVNRCSYPVHLWSIEKQLGCPDGAGLKLEQGEFYYENLRNTTDGGISIKLSKYETCGSDDLTQLEYKLNWATGYEGNFLDISFVNCLTGDCPGWHDGFYFKSGNQEEKIQTSAVDNEHCPVFSVANAIEAAAVAYVKWDDVQTKWCPNNANMELYLCGSEAPSEGGDGYTPAPSSSQQAAPSKEAPSSQYVQKPSSTPKPVQTPSAYSEYANVAAAAVTSAPAAQNPHVVKTEVVYETVYVKRHSHGRRHQHFHA